MNSMKVWNRWWLAGVVVLAGCGDAPEPTAEIEPIVAAQDIQTPAEAEASPEESVAEHVMETESQMNAAQESDEAQTDEAEEPRKSPIKIVPTRPMFQDDWQDEPYEYEDDRRYEDEYEEEYEEQYEVDEGPQIEEFHLKNLREQQSLYIIQDLMPVPGVLIDRYYKGRTEYEVWEWRSYSVEDGETLVRIRFLDGDAANIMINPGEYVLMR